MVKRKLKANKLGTNLQYEEQSQRKKEARSLVKSLVSTFIFISWFLAGMALVAQALAPSPNESMLYLLLMIALIILPIAATKEVSEWGVFK